MEQVIGRFGRAFKCRMVTTFGNLIMECIYAEAKTEKSTWQHNLNNGNGGELQIVDFVCPLLFFVSRTIHFL